ncbi:MAG TPA: SIS domain-containing protein [Candidatus Saccharimonadales bacterium]|nr:SIS domain-containing protein [Candidatus Saccharimonadales bacterium]
MLDDLKFIHQRDPQDALGVAEKQYEQLMHHFAVKPIDFRPEQIVCTGMGGSALGPLISGSWPGYTVPFEIVRNYDIPNYTSHKTLFIASSYSGNTEETLTALAQAEAMHAHIAVIANGGRLQQIAEGKSYPFAHLPTVGQPRFAMLSSLKAVVSLLESTGLLAATAIDDELHKTAKFLQASTSAWRPDVPTVRNRAKQIAQEIIGKSAVIYSGPKLYPAAYKWKIDINENAKHIAWANQYPEFNHNEFIGWSKQPVDKPYTVIELRSSFEHERVQKRFIVSERLLSGLRPAPIVVQAEGNTILEQLVWTIALGDFVSIYTALLNNINPSPVDLVEKFKKALA